jgi:hypothetical protein
MSEPESKWRVVYNNDSTDDGGFCEWYTVTDDKVTFKCDSEADANWLCGLVQRADAMAAYLSTHDHTKHDAAMAACREYLAATAPTPE